MTDSSDIIITYVLDRTGSMSDIWDATTKGFKEFVTQQQQVDGQAYLSLIAFDSDEIQTVYQDMLVTNLSGDIPDDIYPRSMTPLLDAVARAVHTTQQAVDRHNWDGKVIIAINTDGQENASKEYDLQDLKTLVERKQSEGWEFLFMGAGIDAFTTGTHLGIRAANTFSYDHDPAATRAMSNTVAQSVSSYRTSDAAEFTWQDDE